MYQMMSQLEVETHIEVHTALLADNTNNYDGDHPHLNTMTRLCDVSMHIEKDWQGASAQGFQQPSCEAQTNTF